MDATKNRTSVGGLREADPTTLAVLTQDVLRLPLGQIERGTLMDLMALSEVPDQLSSELAKDLARFRDQMGREIADLPDGPPLAEFLEELDEVDAERVPTVVRDIISNLDGERDFEPASNLITDLGDKWEETEPGEITLAAPTTDIDASQETGDGTPRLQKVAAKTNKARRTTTTVDPRREEWIREDVVSRLVKYGSRGLKQSIVVAGSRHRAPWDDLSEAEVLATLRKLKRESRLRFSAGRWMMNG